MSTIQDTCIRTYQAEITTKQTGDTKQINDLVVDFMKLDCCNTNEEQKNISYPLFTKFLNMTGRPIVYSCDTDELFGTIPVFNDERPWLWGPTTCNMWRTWHDIKPYW